MSCKDNYPKAIAVYEAVLRLIQKGRDLTVMTVADIAKEAGIGKGTTYDYFSSKEEIIVKSLIYGYKQMLGEMLERMAGVDSLKDKIAILYEMAQCYEGMSTIVEIVVKLVSGSGEIKKYIKETFECDKINLIYFEKLVQSLTASARAEGLLNPKHPPEYIKYVFLMAIQNATGPLGSMLVKHKTMTRAEQLDYLYEVIVKALT